MSTNYSCRLQFDLTLRNSRSDLCTNKQKCSNQCYKNCIQTKQNLIFLMSFIQEAITTAVRRRLVSRHVTSVRTQWKGVARWRWEWGKRHLVCERECWWTWTQVMRRASGRAGQGTVRYEYRPAAATSY